MNIMENSVIFNLNAIYSWLIMNLYSSTKFISHTYICNFPLTQRYNSYEYSNREQVVVSTLVLGFFIHMEVSCRWRILRPREENHERFGAVPLFSFLRQLPITKLLLLLLLLEILHGRLCPEHVLFVTRAQTFNSSNYFHLLMWISQIISLQTCRLRWPNANQSVFQKKTVYKHTF